MCRRAKVIVCVSNAEREKLRTLYPELGPKIQVIHNGIQPAEDSHPANPAEEPREQPEVPIRAHRRVFGFLGRLDYRKGLLECIKAFKGLDDAELRVACDNQDSAYFSGLLDYIEGAGLNDKVTFYGWCQGPRKQSFLQSLDALIVPSLYEPFGYVVLEAMNAQVPLICSNRGGIPEVVGDYRFCFDPYEPGALRECIRRFQAASAEEVKKEAMALFARLRLFTAQAMCEKTGNRPVSGTSTPAQTTGSTGNPYSTPASGASPPSSQYNIDKWRPILENNDKGPLMQGNDVKELQHALNQLMGWGIAEDSKFGDETEWAVRQFQRRMGIGVDGIVGEETRAALKKALASGGLPPPNTMYETPTPGAPGTPEVASGFSGKLKIEYAQGVPGLEGCDPRLKPVVEELGKRLGASKVIVTETKRTREEHERIYRDRPPWQKVEYETCQHGSVQGYKAADITFFRPDGSRIPPSEVAKVAAEIREVGGIGTYSGLTCAHIDLREKGPDGKPVVWHWDN
ncbi:MAG: glycosyltransferase [Firmicutes bacterium]|nr:glycosyltransferase [Bacillota bacterium]